MRVPDIPDDEPRRLDALCALQLLDSPAEERFDRITRLARRYFDTPIALVSLVDRERQWFKSRQGLQVAETGRDVSFCGHAILSDEILQVPDARTDPRFADNPLVIGPPHIRFYAGAPLHAPDGARVGTLCVIDRQPRELDAEDLRTLRDLADCVEAELARTRLLQGQSELDGFKRTLDLTLDCVFMFDPDSLRFSYVNQGAMDQVGYSHDELMGMHPYDIKPLMPKDRFREMIAPLLSGARAAITFETVHRHRDGHDIPVEVFLQYIAPEGQRPRFVAIVRDIRERKHAEAEIRAKETLLQRLAERVPGVIYQYRYYPDGRSCLPYASEGIREIYEVTPEEVREDASVVFSRLHPDDVEPIMRSILESFRELTPWQFEYRVLLPRRGLRWLRGDAKPERLPDGSVLWHGYITDITEYRQVEEARRESEDKLRKLFEFSPLGIALNSLDGRYLEANPALQRMTGYTLKELNALDYWGLTPGEYEASEQRQLQTLYETGRYGPYEKEYVRKDGSRFPVALNGTLITGRDGRQYIWSTVEDISQRKQYEATMRLQSRAMDAGTMGISIADATLPDMPLIYVNPAFETITGYDRYAVLGCNCRFLQGEDRIQPGLTELRTALREGRPAKVLLRNYRKDGRLFWNEFSLAPVHDEVGRLTHFIGITHDVTDRVEAEQETRRSQSMLDSVIEHMPAMVFMKRASDLRFELLNRAGEELLGYRREELLGRNDHDFFPPVQADAFTATDREVLASRQLLDIPEEPVQTRTGQTRYLHTLKIGLYDEAGEPSHLLGISIDVTERRAAEEALRRKDELARSIGRAQSRFIRDTDTHSLFDGLLADMLGLTQSEYGFIGEVLHGPDGAPYLKTHALTNIAWDEATRRFYDEHAPEGLEFRNLDTLFGAVITSGEVLIANDPGNDPRRGGLPPGHPPMHAFLGVPFFLGETMVGMVGVANRPGGYDMELVDFLQPLLRTLAHIIGALRNEQARLRAQAALERQHEALRALNEIAALPDLEPQAQLRQALALGARHLGLDFGIISRIEGDAYTVEVQLSPPGTLEDGQRFALGETYCSLVMQADDVQALAHVGASAYAGHPCHRNLRLESYIGVPYRVDGRREGTVNFSSIQPRHSEFDAGDLEFMRLLARWVGATLARHRSLALLREGAARTRAIVDNVVDGIITINERGAVESLNPAAERIFGYTATEVVGCNVFLLMPEPHRSAHDGYLQRYLSGGEPRIIGKGREVQGRRKDGTIFPLELSVSEVRLGAQRIFTGVVRDITERKRAEVRLRELSALNEAILDSANYSIIATDVDGTIRRFNAAAERMLGYRAPEVVGRATPAIIHDPQEVVRRATQLSEELGQTIEPGFEVFVSRARRGFVEEREWTYIRRDGSRFPVLLSVTALRDAQGEISGFLGIASDISERKKVERLKNEFISTVSHELRTPLTSIRGALGLVAGGALGPLPSQVMDLVTIASRNSERLLRLINDILDMEKIASGKMKFDLQPQPLLPLVRQAIDTNLTYGAQFGVRYRLDEVGPCADAMVRVDADRLLQVMSNLLSNAAKFSPAGSEVRVAVERRGGHLRVSVIDRGSGIPEAFRPRIFEKFSQADASDSRQRGGSGLGLSISKELVERMGGRIGFETEVGRGTRFHFDLPEWPPVRALPEGGERADAQPARL